MVIYAVIEIVYCMGLAKVIEMVDIVEMQGILFD